MLSCIPTSKQTVPLDISNRHQTLVSNDIKHRVYRNSAAVLEVPGGPCGPADHVASQPSSGLPVNMQVNLRIVAFQKGGQNGPGGCQHHSSSPVACSFRQFLHAGAAQLLHAGEGTIMTGRSQQPQRLLLVCLLSALACCAIAQEGAAAAQATADPAAVAAAAAPAVTVAEGLSVQLLTIGMCREQVTTKVFIWHSAMDDTF